MTTVWGIHNDEFSAAHLVTGGFVSVGWDEVGDLTVVGDDQAAMREALQAAYPEAKEGAFPVWGWHTAPVCVRD